MQLIDGNVYCRFVSNYNTIAQMLNINKYILIGIIKLETHKIETDGCLKKVGSMIQYANEAQHYDPVCLTGF